MNTRKSNIEFIKDIQLILPNPIGRNFNSNELYDIDNLLYLMIMDIKEYWNDQILTREKKDFYQAKAEFYKISAETYKYRELQLQILDLKSEIKKLTDELKSE